MHPPDLAIRPRTDLRLGLLCGIGAGALWGFVFLAPRLTPDFTSLQLAVGRYAAYGLLSALLLGRRIPILLRTLQRRLLLQLSVLGLLGNTLYYALLSLGVRGAGVSTTALVIGFLPVLVSMSGRNDHGAAGLGRMVPSLMFCVAGAFCVGAGVFGAQTGNAGGGLLGLLAAIGALLSWTAFAIGNARALRRLPGLSAQDWNLLTGLFTGAQALLLLPFAFRPEALPRTAGLPGWAGFAALSAFVAVSASIGGNALWNRMSRLLPMTMAGQMILFETVFALIYGCLWDMRWPHPTEIGALVCIVCGVLLAINAHRSARPAPVDA
ncbi:DMT family transporter [Acetobacteraceae bacterium KSS8]|uniref:DMT family transporter n=1 Tax=Endosaccharibacter trunci TaxID=2812733 RepID=A0ABT1W6H4_9PROT|nr:DMT family transporter [Acetobacteraceae bacterium KSS8]